MGFSLVTVKDEEPLPGDPITGTGMNRLLEAAEAAGVDLQSERNRTWGDDREPIKASLLAAFSTNDGWWVTPKEAAELAKKLPKAAAVSEDPPFIREMAQWFGQAAKKGGFYVW